MVWNLAATVDEQGSDFNIRSQGRQVLGDTERGELQLQEIPQVL